MSRRRECRICQVTYSPSKENHDSCGKPALLRPTTAPASALYAAQSEKLKSAFQKYETQRCGLKKECAANAAATASMRKRLGEAVAAWYAWEEVERLDKGEILIDCPAHARVTKAMDALNEILEGK